MQIEVTGTAADMNIYAEHFDTGVPDGTKSTRYYSGALDSSQNWTSFTDPALFILKGNVFSSDSSFTVQISFAQQFATVADTFFNINSTVSIKKLPI